MVYLDTRSVGREANFAILNPHDGSVQANQAAQIVSGLINEPVAK